MTDYTNVSTRALLVALNISVWSAQRFDKEVSDEVASRKAADKSSGRYNKHLFGTRRSGRGIAPEFFAVIDAATAMRNLHNAQTLPWAKRDGARLLPIANYFPYTEAMRKAGAVFNRAVAAFVDAYPRLKDAAEPRLAALFRDDDFLTVDEVKRRFGYDISFEPLPTGTGDVRVDLPAEQIAEIERSVVERMESRARDAMGDAWERLRVAVERIHRACGTTEAGHKSPVYDTLIEHAQEVCGILGRLNVAEDEQLEAMRQRVERELTGIAVEDLRKDERLRQDTERRAAEIIDAMSAFYQPRKEVA